MRIWNTKYALSGGITEHEAEETSNPTMVCIPKSEKTLSYYLHREGEDWHKTRESAIKRAESMRVAKIASLKRQIVKLEGRKFE